MMSATKHVQAEIDADLHREFKAASARSGKSISGVIATAIRNFVVEEERASVRQKERELREGSGLPEVPPS